LTDRPPVDELDPRRLSAEGIERYLRRHGLGAIKSRSQNHIVDGQIIEDIVGLADPAVGSRVLEIGPGLGVLTGALLAAGASRLWRWIAGSPRIFDPDSRRRSQAGS
jgi:hypothetical protein